MFDVDDIPTEQATNMQIQIPPTQQEYEEPPESSEFEKKPNLAVYAVLLITAGVIYMLFIKDTSTPKQTTTTPKVETTKKIAVRTETEIMTDPKVKFDITQELIWVNYRKVLYGTGNVVQFAIECEAPTIGNFHIIIGKDNYHLLEEAGILPITASNNFIKEQGIRYYDDFNLHSNWKDLLNGDIN